MSPKHIFDCSSIYNMPKIRESSFYQNSNYLSFSCLVNTKWELVNKNGSSFRQLHKTNLLKKFQAGQSSLLLFILHIANMGDCDPSSNEKIVLLIQNSLMKMSARNKY